jgi:N-acetylmuramoyl-L-alanine amidase
MKRLFAFGVLVPLAIATIVFAQTSGGGTLRTPAGEHPFTFTQQSGQTYVSAAEVASGLGGTLSADSNGFRVTLGEVVAAFGTDSRYGVVREDLIEMPVPPIMIEGRPFVPWQFFEGLLARAQSLEMSWNPATSTLLVQPLRREAIAVQVSLANVQGISKVVITLSGPADYTVMKESTAYVVRFQVPVRPPFQQQAYEDPQVAAVVFTGTDLRIQLTSPEVVGDAYQLDSPPRIVLDFRKGTGAAPGVVQPPQPQRPQEVPGIRTIVIDPGHGGREVGAVGPNGVLEKDITLAISRRLAAALTAKLGARVVLTRDDDSVVSLDQRTSIANQYDADLFLSVHLNAAVVSNAKGSETYFLSLEASDELARKAAETENASSSAAAMDPGADLKLILWDLAQQAYLDESSLFAQTIQEEMNAASGVANRGVKQAPFKVLVGATMPAALVEVGFITNPEEEAKLQSDAFQTLMVNALTRAVERYKAAYEVRIGVAQPPSAPAPTPTAGRAPGATPPAVKATPTAPTGTNR